MKAIVAHQGQVLLTDIPAPEVIDPDEVILKVRLVGLCRTDIYVAQGLVAAKPQVVLGHEFCADVAKIGTAVRHVALGQRVGVMPVRIQDDVVFSLGREEDGAFAEYIRVKASAVYPLPDTLTDQEAAYLEPVAASLAVLRAPLTPTMFGLVYGDNRIAALTCAVLAHAGHCSVHAAAHGDALLVPNHYDFIFETLATEEALLAMVRALKPGGILVLKSRPANSVALPLRQIVEKEIRVIGTHYAPFEDAIALIGSHAIDLRPMFGPIGSFEDALSVLTGQTVVSEQYKLFFRP